MRAERRETFDRLLEDELDCLPPLLAEVLDEVPLIVEDEPSPRLLAELGMEPDEDLCGLQWGVPLSEAEGERDLPDRLMVFRGPVWRLARDEARANRAPLTEELARQIHVTLWHELGHALGLDEDELDALGYA